MEWKAVVRFLGDPAHYKIITDRSGVYHARLLKYDGPSGITPPEEIVLVKGIRRWNGSYDIQEFIDELGRVIETRQRGGSSPSAQRPEPTGA
jgi:hypothetical protein